MIMSHTYDKASSGAKIEGMVTNARTSCPFDNEAFFFFIFYFSNCDIDNLYKSRSFIVKLSTTYHTFL